MDHTDSFWFIVGSQTLYSEDVLTTAASRAARLCKSRHCGVLAMRKHFSITLPTALPSISFGRVTIRRCSAL